MKHLFIKTPAALIAATFLLACCAYGQKVNGTIVGTVTDSSGAEVPNASAASFKPIPAAITQCRICRREITKSTP
ncbi:MAG: carboxypeptidase-like regulatory domain-containing protein [Acidobacteriota bacterium]|nr:carboxypeptidase-like regulatory domain-containing protein [Acidobacteriota bacterium]